ncbi:hypothetical protein QK342_15295 [Myroides odoratimimus]|uniref:hypothetical protein n=1 Tax=Myroides odoratimimus TaxID=76832 RepID=UPI00103A8519|nr:hypothetical protein [Myroides odoratimimus]QBK77607.1 hypothetical protein E0Z07_15240 [Myroides odoratimimus]WHT73054.1 hypothetical protein QK342_15295 [Myroides odoratimimus]WHU37637.1 hypothetical protein QNM93_15280 [Myroides odoratimimus]
MESNFIKDIDNGCAPLKQENVYDSIFVEYERVVIQSLITSFGLDFLVSDQYGGDVDTINNVRQIDKDRKLKYKSSKNEDTYNNKEVYDGAGYHNSGNFRSKKHNAREKWQETGVNIKDEYTGGSIGFHGHTKAITPDKKAELDHIISAKEIHEDRGRVLSGLSGKELADAEENFAWTNKSLNASMQDKTIEQYIALHPELDEETKTRMLEKDRQARKNYNAKINVSYYTSSAFFKESAKAATKVGVSMGLRQALGLIFSEIWFAVREQIKTGKQNGEDLFNSIAEGIKNGYNNARSKYKEIWQKFIEGAIAGVLSSLTTTLCNIFFTTAKSLVRIIRNCWASLVEATKILLFNPDCLPFGERFRAASKIIATGASIVVGSVVGDMIASSGAGAIPVLGEVVQVFSMTLVTGIMSCSLLYLLDNNSTINKLVEALNSIPTIDDFVIYSKMQAELLEEYCVKLMDIDLAQFKKETELYNNAVVTLQQVDNQQDFKIVLQEIYKKANFKSPFGDHTSIDSFMKDKNNTLTFN